MEYDDQALVARFQGGDETAFNELVTRHRKDIYFLAMGLVGTQDDAEDLAQDAFVRAYESLPKFRGQSSFRTWLYRIALNLCLNEVRKRKVRRLISLDNPGTPIVSREAKPDEAIEEAEQQKQLAAAVGKLPPQQKRVFALRYFSEMTYAEIAETLDRKIGTVKANYFQAIQKLRAALKD
jgi:RNA polymerase sigma-70 factor (ECF subfamily)